ncbi:hypothetical protein AB0B79_38685 [Streptomyces sp. NPDC039022]|uniref:hypothetical protein n=1 Tax=unclassified Streptomyces TaxID=2593676 RepID=UPI0033FDC366
MEHSQEYADTSYPATSFVWLGRAEDARQHAVEGLRERLAADAAARPALPAAAPPGHEGDHDG